MVQTSWATGEDHTGCTKSLSSDPCDLNRETSNVKGFGGRALGNPTFHASRFTVLGSDARTPHGKRRVSARQGWAGEKSDYFNIR
jgi:hypothetical protein